MTARKLTVRKSNSNRSLVIEIYPIDPKEDTVDLLREARDRLIDQVGNSPKGKVSFGKLLSQKVS